MKVNSMHIHSTYTWRTVRVVVVVDLYTDIPAAGLLVP